MKIHRKSYLPLIIIIGLFILMYLIGSRVSEGTIKKAIEDAGPWGIVLLIFFFWICNVVAPLSGSPFLFAGFYSYGQMVVVYAFLASIIASITNFWIARIWGRKIVEKLAGENSLKKIDELTSNYGLPTLFITRLFLKEFHDVISYVFGLTKLRFSTYFSVSTLGMIPATIIWYLISMRIQNAITFTVVSWAIAYVSLIIYGLALKFLAKKYKSKK